MTPKPSYTALNDELKSLMESLESGELDIDEAVRCYERGLRIVKELEGLLKEAENKVTALKASALEEIDE